MCLLRSTAPYPTLISMTTMTAPPLMTVMTSWSSCLKPHPPRAVGGQRASRLACRQSTTQRSVVVGTWGTWRSFPLTSRRGIWTERVRTSVCPTVCSTLLDHTLRERRNTYVPRGYYKTQKNITSVYHSIIDHSLHYTLFLWLAVHRVTLVNKCGN